MQGQCQPHWSWGPHGTSKLGKLNHESPKREETCAIPEAGLDDHTGGDALLTY